MDTKYIIIYLRFALWLHRFEIHNVIRKTLKELSTIDSIPEASRKSSALLNTSFIFSTLSLFDDAFPSCMLIHSGVNVSNVSGQSRLPSIPPSLPGLVLQYMIRTMRKSSSGGVESLFSRPGMVKKQVFPGSSVLSDK